MYAIMPVSWKAYRFLVSRFRISIADVYDALTSDRPCRSRMQPFEALKLMKDEMIHHFQKDLFEQFVKMLS
jgi:HD-GYP domain-containing protein (c-di-GMP phosphodiesterase class II)